MAFRVYVVDDNADNRFLMRRRLEGHPFIDIVGEANEAANLAAGVSVATPDAILLDLRMPGLSGLSAIPELRELFPSVAIVIWTATDVSVVEQALGLGAVAFAPKSLSMDEAIKVLEKVAADRGLS